MLGEMAKYSETKQNIRHSDEYSYSDEYSVFRRHRIFVFCRNKKAYFVTTLQSESNTAVHGYSETAYSDAPLTMTNLTAVSYTHLTLPTICSV